MTISLTEAQELHELIGAALIAVENGETAVIAELERARELAAVLVSDAEKEEESEFGSGVVVCLAKFSEHLANHMYDRVARAIWWSEASEEKREAQRKEAEQFPRGDAAVRIRDAESVLRMGETPEQGISREIEMWMNAASDHMYGIDRDLAPPSLVKLADLTLTVGHGFTGRTWTKETVTEIHQLWQDACLETDALIGAKADWGQW